MINDVNLLDKIGVHQQILSDLEGRYTTKKYDKNRKVSQLDLNVLYESLRLSPSSINSQPWKFIVLESEQAKQRMYDTFTDKFQFNREHILACSHVILFAHNPSYNKSDYEKVVDTDISLARTPKEGKEQAFAKYAFVELNTDERGENHAWTKAQTYIALGNALHTLARLKIDSTAMEGIDSSKVEQTFAEELEGFRCELALAIGYHDCEEDYNAKLAKSRLDKKTVLKVI